MNNKIKVILFGLFFQVNASAMSLGDLKKDVSKENRQLQHMYVMGAGQAIFWSNSMLKVRGKQPIFCPPSDLRFTGQYFLNLLEEIKKDSSYVGREETGIELILYAELEKKFNCSNQVSVEKNTPQKLPACEELSALVNKQMPRKINEYQTVVEIYCAKNKDNKTAFVYKNQFKFPSENLVDQIASYKQIEPQIKNSVKTSACKDPNIQIFLKEWIVRYEYVTASGAKLDEIDITENDCKPLKN